MTRQTALHNWTVPTEGADDYEDTFDTLFADLDRNGELRDVESNLTDYSPKSGAKFRATDTENVFIGDGTTWNQVQSSGKNPNFDSVSTARSIIGESGGQTYESSRLVNVPTSGEEILEISYSSAGRYLVGQGTTNEGGGDESLHEGYWTADGDSIQTSDTELFSENRDISVGWNGRTLIANASYDYNSDVVVYVVSLRNDVTWLV